MLATSLVWISQHFPITRTDWNQSTGRKRRHYAENTTIPGTLFLFLVTKLDSGITSMAITIVAMRGPLTDKGKMLAGESPKTMRPFESISNIQRCYWNFTTWELAGDWSTVPRILTDPTSFRPRRA